MEPGGYSHTVAKKSETQLSDGHTRTKYSGETSLGKSMVSSCCIRFLRAAKTQIVQVSEIFGSPCRLVHTNGPVLLGTKRHLDKGYMLNVEGSKGLLFFKLINQRGLEPY